MKKSILLFALPALLALSGCANVNIKAPEKENEFIFAEDAEAHSELFGGKEEWFGFKKQPLLAMTPGEGSLTKPYVGVQYLVEPYEKDVNGDSIVDDCSAVRFIAGVVNLNVKAVWTRAAYRVSDGSIVGSRSPVETTKAYTAINDGGEMINATEWADETGSNYPYNYFVIYTIYDIPVASLDDYYFVANLKLSNPEDASEFIESDVVFTNQPNDSGIDEEGNTRKFPADKTGYFAMVFNSFGKTKSYVSEDSPTRNDSGNLASFTLNLEEFEGFIIIRNDIGESKFRIYDSSILTYADNSAVLESFAAMGVYVVAKEAGKFALYLNNDAELYKAKYTQTADIYVIGPAGPNLGVDGWTAPDTTSPYRFFACPSEDNNRGELLNIHLNVGDFKVASGNWSGDEWAYWGFKHKGWEGYDQHGSSSTVTGGGASNFSPNGEGRGANIHCDHAGYYNLYVTNDDWLSIEVVSLDPVEP